MSSPTQAPAQQPPDAQASQAGLAIALGLALAALWPNLDLTNLRRDLPAFKAAVAQQVQRYAAASATLAARQYAQQRKAAVGGGFSPRPAGPPPVEQVAQSVDWAVQPLWNSNVLAAIAGKPEAEPTDTLPSASTAIADAKARLAASTERLVLNAGGDTITDNVLRDRKAKGYVRLTEGKPCWLCIMLATRGMVYKEHSFDAANARFKAPPSPAGLGEELLPARAHDNCRCHLAPVFTAYEPTAQERAWQGLWASSTRGKSGNAARIAFRQAVEGRTAPTK